MKLPNTLRGNIKSFLIVGIVLLGVTAVTAFVAISSLRQEAIATKRHIASLHANTFEENFSALLHRTEQTMDNIPFLSNQRLEEENIISLFRNVLQNTPYIRSLSLLDTKGKIILSSSKKSVGLNISFDNFYPKPFGDNAILRLGVPWEGRDFANAKQSSIDKPLKADSLYFLPVMKKVYFDKKPYIMLASINPYYLLNNYLAILPAAVGHLNFYRNDGILLLSTDKNLQLGSSHFITEHAHDENNLYEHMKKTSHLLIEHIKESLSLPFVVQVSLDEKKALSYWENERSQILWLSIALIVICGVLGFLLLLKYYRELSLKKEQLSYEKQFRIAMEATKTGLWRWNFLTGEVTWDKQCYLLLGYEPDAFVPNLKKIRELTYAEDSKDMHKQIKEMVTSNGEFLIERRMLTADRKWVWILVRGKVIEYTSDNKPLILTGIYNNIDMQKKAEQLHLNAVAFDSQEAILITDTNEKIIKINEGFTKITGYTESEVLGKTPRILKSGEHDKKFYKKMWASLKETGYYKGEIWNRRKNGEIYAEFVTITAIRNKEDTITHYLANFNDITSYKMSQRHIKKLAYHDPLTQLANRRFLEKSLEELIKKSKEGSFYSAVIFIDLDDFKKLNDTYGHASGDMLLVQTANRLLEIVRQSDVVSRFGGDEFVVLLENLGSIPSKNIADKLAYEICKKILTSLSEPYALSFGNYHSSASIGYSIFSGEENKDVQELIKEADSAMYISKETGKNQVNTLIP